MGGSNNPHLGGSNEPRLFEYVCVLGPDVAHICETRMAELTRIASVSAAAEAKDEEGAEHEREDMFAQKNLKGELVHYAAYADSSSEGKQTEEKAPNAAMHMFVFPDGVNITRTRPQSFFHSFVLTELDGRRVYAFCYTTYCVMPDELLAVARAEVGILRNPDGLSEAAHVPDAIYGPRSVCIVSALPFFQSFKCLLSTFFDHSGHDDSAVAFPTSVADEIATCLRSALPHELPPSTIQEEDDTIEEDSILIGRHNEPVTASDSLPTSGVASVVAVATDPFAAALPVSSPPTMVINVTEAEADASLAAYNASRKHHRMSSVVNIEFTSTSMVPADLTGNEVVVSSVSPAPDPFALESASPKALPMASLSSSLGSNYGLLGESLQKAFCVQFPPFAPFLQEAANDAPSQSLPIFDFDFQSIFTLLDASSITTIFEALLMEQPVLVVSSHIGVLSDVLETLLALLYPFKWQYVYIPVLPSRLSMYLEAPQPYLIGGLPALADQCPSHTLQVHLDRRQVIEPDYDNRKRSNKSPRKSRWWSRSRSKSPASRSSSRSRDGSVATAADFTGEPEGPCARLPLLLRGRLQQSILRYQLQLKQRAPEGDVQYEPEAPSEQFPFSLETATAMVGDYQPNINNFERRLSFSISTSPDARMRSVSPAVRASQVEGGAPKSGLSQSVAHLVASQDSSSYMGMNMNMHDHYGAASDIHQAPNGYDSLDEVGLSDRKRERKKPSSAPRRESEEESAADDKMTMALLATRLRKRFVEMFVSLLQGYHSCINDAPDGTSELTMVELFDTKKFIRLTTEHFRGFNRALSGYQCFANFIYQRASMIDFDYFDKKVLQHIQIVVRKSNIDKAKQLRGEVFVKEESTFSSKWQPYQFEMNDSRLRWTRQIHHKEKTTLKCESCTLVLDKTVLSIPSAMQHKKNKPPSEFGLMLTCVGVDPLEQSLLELEKKEAMEAAKAAAAPSPSVSPAPSGPSTLDSTPDSKTTLDGKQVLTPSSKVRLFHNSATKLDKSEKHKSISRKLGRKKKRYQTWSLASRKTQPSPLDSLSRTASNHDLSLISGKNGKHSKDRTYVFYFATSEARKDFICCVDARVTQVTELTKILLSSEQKRLLASEHAKPAAQLLTGLKRLDVYLQSTK